MITRGALAGLACSCDSKAQTLQGLADSGLCPLYSDNTGDLVGFYPCSVPTPAPGLIAAPAPASGGGGLVQAPRSVAPVVTGGGVVKTSGGATVTTSGDSGPVAIDTSGVSGDLTSETGPVSQLAPSPASASGAGDTSGTSGLLWLGLGALFILGASKEKKRRR